MKKKAAKKSPAPRKTAAKSKSHPAGGPLSDATVVPLFDRIATILDAARGSVVRAVNSRMVLAYWLIGREIVQDLQGGDERAAYGKKVIADLSKQLTKCYGSGYSPVNLAYFRRFHLVYADREARIFHAVRARSGNETIFHALSEKSLTTKDPESMESKHPTHILKSSTVLEFLGLPDHPRLHESRLEQAIMDNLQTFLLELGRGFSFVARQRRLLFGDEEFYVDLVFYNYLLKCFVLIDLKMGKLTHQDIGQMDGYVRMYEDLYKVAGDNPTIGLILCTEKTKTIARYSVLKESQQLFASKYRLHLPTEEELAAELQREILAIQEGRAG